MNEFSEFVRNMRAASGLSTKELALRIGVSKSTIGNYENGHKIPEDTSEFERRLRIVVKREVKKRRESHAEIS